MGGGGGGGGGDMDPPPPPDVECGKKAEPGRVNKNGRVN